MWIDENGFPRTKRYEIRMSKSVAGEACLRIFKDGSPLNDGHLVILNTDDVIPCCFINKRAAEKLGIKLVENDKFAGFDPEKIRNAKRKKPKPGPSAVSKELKNGYRLETGADTDGDPALVLTGNGAHFALTAITDASLNSRLVVYCLSDDNAEHARKAGLKINTKNEWETA